MKFAVLWLIPFTAIVAAASQATAPSKDARQKNSTVRVRGCLQGTEVVVTEDQGFVLPGGRVNLKGGRELMKSLREYNGHEVEVVGVLKTTSQTAVAMKEKRGGKTRVYAGVSEHRSGSADTLAVAPVLEAREVTPLGPACR